MKKYYFTYRLETSVEAESLKEAKKAFDDMELQDLIDDTSTIWIELNSVTDESNTDLMAEYRALD